MSEYKFLPPKKPAEPLPSIGRAVHYVSFGSPVRPDGTQQYPSLCRAAIITEVADEESVDGVAIVVLNPTGAFFTQGVRHDEGHTGGTWHWPERVGA